MHAVFVAGCCRCCSRFCFSCCYSALVVVFVVVTLDFFCLFVVFFIVAHLLWKQFCKTWTRFGFICETHSNAMRYIECHCKWLHMFCRTEMNNSNELLNIGCYKANKHRNRFSQLLFCNADPDWSWAALLLLLLPLPLPFGDGGYFHTRERDSEQWVCRNVTYNSQVNSKAENE